MSLRACTKVVPLGTTSMHQGGASKGMHQGGASKSMHHCGASKGMHQGGASKGMHQGGALRACTNVVSLALVPLRACTKR